MAVKNTTQVLIDGKIITLGGYESPEYLQKVGRKIQSLSPDPSLQGRGSEFAELTNQHHQCYQTCKQIGYRHAVPHSCHSEKLRQDKQARKQDQHLPGEGKEYRFACHAYALEKVGSHHLETDDREAEEDDAHAFDRQADQLGIVRKGRHRQPGRQLAHQEPGARDARGTDDRQPQHAQHTVVLPRTEVITRNGLHPLVDAHDDHHEEESQPIDDTVSTDIEIAAVLLESLVDEDDNHARSQVHEEWSQSDSDDVFHQYSPQTVYSFMEMNDFVFLVQQVDELAE